MLTQTKIKQFKQIIYTGHVRHDDLGKSEQYPGITWATQKYDYTYISLRILRIIQRSFFLFLKGTICGHQLDKTVLKVGHKICFYGEILQIIHVTPSYLELRLKLLK